MNALQYSESPPWMTSPTSPSNSDNNVYGSPALSPGSWNVVSPTNVTNNNSAGEWANLAPTSPSGTSVPSAQKTTHDFIGLPKELGQRADFEKDELQIRREKAAHYKAQKLMSKTFGACSNSLHAPVMQPKPASAKYADIMLNKYERGEQIRREKIAKYKQQKLISKSTGVSMSDLKAPVSPTSIQTATTYNNSASSSMSPSDIHLIGSPLPPYKQHVQSPVDEIGYSMSQTSISPISTHLIGSPLSPHQQPADQQPQPAVHNSQAFVDGIGYPMNQAPMSSISSHQIGSTMSPYHQESRQQPSPTVQTSPATFDAFECPTMQTPMLPTSTQLVGSGYPVSQPPMSPTSTYLVGSEHPASQPPMSPISTHLVGSPMSSYQQQAHQQSLPPLAAPRVPVNDGGSAIRQAAIRRYKEKKKQAKYGGNGSSPSGSEGVSMVPTSALYSQRQEQLATSTRNVKSQRSGSGVVTCQLDRDRQKAAQSKALRLLQSMG